MRRDRPADRCGYRIVAALPAEFASAEHIGITLCSREPGERSAMIPRVGMRIPLVLA